MSTSKDFLLEWTRRHPFDYYWRKKYNVPFLSEQHLDTCPIDQKLEWELDKFISKELEKERAFEDAKKNPYSWLKKKKDVGGVKEKELLNNFDWSSLNKK